jgi:hypothetical protein
MVMYCRTYANALVNQPLGCRSKRKTDDDRPIRKLVNGNEKRNKENKLFNQLDHAR